MNKIIDVTLRDGGYLNNWEFSKEQIKDICFNLDRLKVNYIEVGYLTNEHCLGMDNKSALKILEEIKESSYNSQLLLMVNPKNKAVSKKIVHFNDYISWIRIPCDFTNLKEAMMLAEDIKKTNIKVSLNLISITQYNYDELLNFISKISTYNLVDIIYVADSRGSLHPNEVYEIIQIIKDNCKKPIGFHAHNNLNLAHQNTLMSIQAGCEFIDGSVKGFGLGGGNADTEFLLRNVKNLDLENDKVKLNLQKLIQLVKLQKPKGLEEKLYRLSGEKNLEQEWVPIIFERYGKNAMDIIGALLKKNYKNQEDINKIILECKN